MFLKIFTMMMQSSFQTLQSWTARSNLKMFQIHPEYKREKQQIVTIFGALSGRAPGGSTEHTLWRRKLRGGREGPQVGAAVVVRR